MTSEENGRAAVREHGGPAGDGPLGGLAGGPTGDGPVSGGAAGAGPTGATGGEATTVLSPRLLRPDDALPAPLDGDRSGAPHAWLLRVSEHTAAAGAHEYLLDAEERSRAAAFLREADRDRYRVAHVALRRLLGACLDSDPAGLRLVREDCPGCGGPHGRPAVAGAPLHFSLSHAADLVLIAVAGVPVGADVEREPAPSVAAEIAARLHERERVEMAALPERDRPAAFTRCWSRKEAYLKGIGIGLAEDPSVTYVGAGATPGRPPGWVLRDVAVPSGYAAACALRDGTGSPAASADAGR
ncbi:4'-phosphopantetheinyl transferase family protein [Streptomyces sp. URMC 123]|uniref:4'-phosphopantetheinyl transferase family protein n=1 Tax=Streptomyces sp. URMC 123 TaxID=3423403 RepID=UPI003F19AE68